jgi:hypothetical protein
VQNTLPVYMASCIVPEKQKPHRTDTMGRVFAQKHRSAGCYPDRPIFRSVSLIRTYVFHMENGSPSVPELHRIGAACQQEAFADCTAGGDFHSAPKQRLK